MNDSDKTGSLAEREQGTDRSCAEADAKLDSLSVHQQAKMGRTGDEPLVTDQSTCLLFRLPPELRNNIYIYVAYSNYGSAQSQWDEENNCPSLDLTLAQPRVPPNDLSRTCRSVYAGSKGVFLKAQREYWSDTTFTLQLDRWPSLSSFDYLERLNDQQVGHMARVNIHTDVPMPFTVHLRSGSAAASSVSVPACTHRSWFPVPLAFVDRMLGAEKLSREYGYGHLHYREVSDILWLWSGNRSASDPYLRLCVEHHAEPFVLSVPKVSRTGLMAVVAWACDGQRCKVTG